MALLQGEMKALFSFLEIFLQEMALLQILEQFLKKNLKEFPLKVAHHQNSIC